MAANKILNELWSLIDFAQTGFKYNLQIFPDTVTAAALLFSLLFQSPPLAALSGSIILLNFIHPVMGGFLSSVLNGTVGADAFGRCSGRFPGVSFDRLTSLSASSGFGALEGGGWPSYYTVFLGFLTAYIGALPFIYEKELAASPKRRSAVIFGQLLIAVVLIMGVIYRIGSGCDSVFGSFVGVVAGGFIGVACALFLAWISERRLTNILAFPLIRDRAADGKPIYVCAKSA
jgi:hypothetical protein